MYYYYLRWLMLRPNSCCMLFWKIESLYFTRIAIAWVLQLPLLGEALYCRKKGQIVGFFCTIHIYFHKSPPTQCANSILRNLLGLMLNWKLIFIWMLCNTKRLTPSTRWTIHITRCFTRKRDYRKHAPQVQQDCLTKVPTCSPVFLSCPIPLLPANTHITK